MDKNKTLTAQYWGVEDGARISVTTAKDTVTFIVEGKLITLERWRAEKLAEFINESA